MVIFSTYSTIVKESLINVGCFLHPYILANILDITPFRIRKYRTHTMANPLLNIEDLPKFSAIRAEHVETAIDQVLACNRQAIQDLFDSKQTPSWNNIIAPLDDLRDELNKTWSPISHLNAVLNNKAMREPYNRCVAKLANYHTELGQNDQLFKAYNEIANGPEYENLDSAQQKVIDNALRDFRLAGVDLPDEKKQRFKEIKQRLATLKSAFSDNVLDATQAWTRLIEDPNQLAGVPESALALAKQSAQQKGQQGWLLTLEFPCYFAIISYADNRQLRHEIYDAFVTRASDQDPQAKQWDNSPLMLEILTLRYELAQLLGYNNFAEYSLATKMADSTDDVLKFLNELAMRAKQQAEMDYKALEEFAKFHYDQTTLEPWDIAYYSEKLRQHEFSISQEELKPYFPDTQVIQGLLSIVKRLYAIESTPVTDFDSWHKDVRFYRITDADGELRGHIYVDLYARTGKRGGAWMDSFRSRRVTSDGIQSPVAFVTCNFSPPIGDDPALLTHNEVTTLFHEFGHALHHILTQVDYLPVSGINGVPWDAVELPSQFLENWCWEKESISLISGHYQTKQPLPDTLFDKLQAAKNFQSAMQTVRQLEFALFDLRLHVEFLPDKKSQIQQILDEVRHQVAVVKIAPNNRFQHSFSHIFSGGYGAGYYSYKWAEVLSADAYSKFEENGIFDSRTGHQFLTSILQRGGSADPMDMFVEFRGRKPSVDALLRHNGIS
jgi:oligopeptidase A